MDTITPELLATYDVPTPRYTSYPTALAFEPRTEIVPPRAQDADRPLSLYFHMIFCRHLCWYCACTKEITREQSRSGEYIDRLMDELERRAAWLDHRPIVQMHLGGGTPTFFSATELAALTRFVRDRFQIAPEAELSVEIDPRELSDRQVASLAKSGFTRASLGVQDHDPKVQAAIHRDQPYEMTADAVNRLRAAGIEAINFDLVYGLPHQTPESFRRTVEEVAALKPNRLAVYSYAHVPGAAPAQRLRTKDVELPDASSKIAMFLAAAAVLDKHGYEHIGMDHFARPDDTLSAALRDGTLRRNFMGYTTERGVDIHAFGASAISQTESGYFQNERDLAGWQRAIDEDRPAIARGVTLTADDKLRRAVIMAVMCSNTVDFATIGAPFGFDATAHLAEELESLAPLEADGLVSLDGTRLTVTRLGRFLVRNVAATFDATKSRDGYSRAV